MFFFFMKDYEPEESVIMYSYESRVSVLLGFIESRREGACVSKCRLREPRLQQITWIKQYYREEGFH